MGFEAEFEVEVEVEVSTGKICGMLLMLGFMVA